MSQPQAHCFSVVVDGTSLVTIRSILMTNNNHVVGLETPVNINWTLGEFSGNGSGIKISRAGSILIDGPTPRNINLADDRIAIILIDPRSRFDEELRIFGHWTGVDQAMSCAAQPLVARNRCQKTTDHTPQYELWAVRVGGACYCFSRTQPALEDQCQLQRSERTGTRNKLAVPWRTTRLLHGATRAPSRCK